MKRPRHGFVLLGLLCILTGAYLEVASGQGAANAHVVVVNQTVSADYVNITVTTYTRSGMIRSAGLFLNQSLVSNELGGVWLHYDTKQVLAFRLRTLTSRVELRIVYEWTQGSNSTVSTQTSDLTLMGAANVRPVGAHGDERNNLTIRLQNLGQGTAPELLASLEDTAGAIIGDPYYRPVPRLVAGATHALSFQTASIPNKAILVLESGGHRALFPLNPRGGAAGDGVVRFTTDYPSLDAAPGGTAQFGLKLTNQGGERLLRLELDGLPENYRPLLSVGGRAVQTLQVPAGAVRDVSLTLHVPPGVNLTDGSLRFELRALDAGSGQRLGSIALTLTAAGAPRLDLAGRNWNARLSDGVAELVLGIENSGTAPAHNVALKLAPPPGWTAEAEPETIERLDPGKTAEVRVRLTPPKGTGDGRYVVDVIAQAPGIAPSRERSLSVEVDEPAPSRLPWILAVGVAGAAATTLIVRAKRR